MMTGLGVTPEVAEGCLNHTEEKKVKRTYQRHSYSKEMSEAWNSLGTQLKNNISVNSAHTNHALLFSQ